MFPRTCHAISRCYNSSPEALKHPGLQHPAPVFRTVRPASPDPFTHRVWQEGGGRPPGGPGSAGQTDLASSHDSATFQLGGVTLSLSASVLSSVGRTWRSASERHPGMGWGRQGPKHVSTIGHGLSAQRRVFSGTCLYHPKGLHPTREDRSLRGSFLT